MRTVQGPGRSVRRRETRPANATVLVPWWPRSVSLPPRARRPLPLKRSATVAAWSSVNENVVPTGRRGLRAMLASLWPARHTRADCLTRVSAGAVAVAEALGSVIEGVVVDGAALGPPPPPPGDPPLWATGAGAGPNT